LVTKATRYQNPALWWLRQRDFKTLSFCLSECVSSHCCAFSAWAVKSSKVRVFTV